MYGWNEGHKYDEGNNPNRRLETDKYIMDVKVYNDIKIRGKFDWHVVYYFKKPC